jgi:hypothetical protein
MLIGGALISAIATTSLAQYTRVLGNGDLAEDDPTFSAKRSVVLSSTQVVSLVEVGFAGTTQIVASEYVAGNWVHTPLAVAGDTAFGGGGVFTGFESLSLSPGTGTPVVTFIGERDGSIRAIDQSTFNPTPTPTRVAIDGGSIGPRTTAFDSALRIGTNASGAVAFGAADGSDDVLWRYDGTNYTKLADTTVSSSLTHFNESNTDVYPKYRVVTSTGSVVGFAKDGSSGAIYEFSDAASSISGASPRVSSSGYVDGSQTFKPVQVLGATAGALGRTLYIGVDDTAPNGPEARILLNPGSNVIVDVTMGQSFSAADAQIGAAALPSGTITPGGRAAVYVPRFDQMSQDQSQLFVVESDGAQIHMIEPGQSIRRIGGTAFTLETIGTVAGAQPAINDQGWVVFDATNTDGDDMLVAWNPEQGVIPVAIAYVGQTFTLAGDPATYTVQAINIRGDVEFDTDVFKDLLAEDGTVAFGIEYTNGVDTFQAVVSYDVNTVPEPAGLTLMLAAAGVILGRRRGGRSGSANRVTADLA